jgi:hypothetical protein
MGEDRTPDDVRAAGTGHDMAGYATALADAVESALGRWIHRSVVDRHPQPLTGDLEARIEASARAAVADIGRRLRDLLALDIDDQWTNPLSIIRDAVAYPTGILREAGVEPVDRDATARRLQPDDLYDLTPASFADLGAEVHEPGLLWGAAKAHVHLTRRRLLDAPRRAGTGGREAT